MTDVVPRRRWQQFCLMTLLIVLTLSAVYAWSYRIRQEALCSICLSRARSSIGVFGFAAVFRSIGSALLRSHCCGALSVVRDPFSILLCREVIDPPSLRPAQNKDFLFHGYYRQLPRRWFRFSLRTFFVLLTIACVWLGIGVNRARNQRLAVEQIRALGGRVSYDYQYPLIADRFHTFRASEPEWVMRLLGVDFSHHPVALGLDRVGDEAAPALTH